MATQSGELPQVLAEGETRDRGNRTRQEPEGSLSREVSRAMANLLKSFNGRGATQVHTYIHEDLVVVVLRRTMTQAERTLADEGEEALVRGVRRAIQGKFREDANGIVERLTGRHVSAFLSDQDVDEDVVIQAFLLEPGPNGTS